MKYNLKDKQKLEIKIIEKASDKIYFDFFINQKQLSKLLGIDRLDMAYYSFDLDYYEVDKERFPNYDRKKVVKNAVSCFLGNNKPMNQFGTNRIVLYRCHCGCDYCGVISFVLHVENDVIIWKDITYEDDDFEFEEELKRRDINSIKELKFDKREYLLEFETHKKKYYN